MKTDYYGGRDSYVSGKVHLYSTQKLYIYLGGSGKAPSNCSKNHIGRGGFNGGSGDAGIDIRDDDPSGGGGGASDVRLINNSDPESLYSRILVAAGGSGSCFNGYGAPGGDLTGYQPTTAYTKKFYRSNTNQTNGNSLGYGANGKDSENTPDSGGGGGYYGGNIGESIQSGSLGYKSASSSGSSYISGHFGCNSIDRNGVHTNRPDHYSGIVFEQTKMYNGLVEFLSPEGILEEGHIGDGAIQITPIFIYTLGSKQYKFSLEMCIFLLS